MAAARRALPPYAAAEGRAEPGVLPEPNSVPATSAGFPWPPSEGCLNDAIVDDPAVHALARRWLGTPEICLRGAGCSVRYPGFTDGTGRHTDGFSLLPASGTDRAHNQLKFWYYLSDVGPGMAPISFWPTQWSDDGPSVCGPEESFQAPAGSL